MNSFAMSALLAMSTSITFYAAQAETVLIASDPGPNHGIRAAAVSYLAEQSAETTGGEVRVENNWGGALLKTTAATDSLSTADRDDLQTPRIPARIARRPAPLCCFVS